MSSDRGNLGIRSEDRGQEPPTRKATASRCKTLRGSELYACFYRPGWAICRFGTGYPRLRRGARFCETLRLAKSAKVERIKIA